jgi:hypothetical protein
MRRFLVLGLIVLASAMTMGCEQKSKTQSKETTSGPGGTTTTTDTHQVESSGKNPPPNTQGETAK